MPSSQNTISPSIILGITNNDLSGAALLIDGHVTAAASEERFNREKEYRGWPTQSIAYVLSTANVPLEKVSRIAYGWSAGFDASKHLELYVDRMLECVAERPDEAKIILQRLKDEFKNDKPARKEFDSFAHSNNVRGRVSYVDHHESHAIGAFSLSGFPSALVISCDGRGDFQSLTVSHFRGKECVPLLRETSSDSLGYFYGRLTRLLGYQHNRHEGKLTGLAAYGDPSKARHLMEEMISYGNGRLRAHCGRFFSPYYDQFSDDLLREIAKHRPEDIAAAGQLHLEDILCSVLKDYLPKALGESRICLAGGVFGNVKLNQRLREVEGVSEVFVLPCMGDGGLALAAASAVHWNQTGRGVQLPSMSLGPEFPDYVVPPDLTCIADANKGTEPFVDAIVSELAQGSVVGVIRGRMEFGPRALCNRSMLCSPTDPSINKRLNDRLGRTEFMPFAPVTIRELAPVSFRGWTEDRSSRYMTMTYDCQEGFRERCSAVVHVDGTARPQIVYREEDEFMHRLITKWHRTSGCEALVNTSFNRHEEPIICRPEDGVRSLREGIVDALLINDSTLLKCA